MRIVFMGTPEFAVSVLRHVVEGGWEVCAVYTQPDKPKNRGMKLVPTPVKEYALTKGISVYQPASCRDPETLAQLEALAPDVILVAAYGKILPQALLDIPRLAILNVLSAAPVPGCRTHQLGGAERGHRDGRHHSVHGGGTGRGGYFAL